MTLFRSPLVVLDTETTGLMDAWVRIVEIGAVLLDVDGAEVDAFSTLVLPDVLDDRASRALEINHLTREMLADAPDTMQALALFRDWMRAHGGPYVTAYNVAFDRTHMERAGARELRWANCVMLRAREPMGHPGTYHGPSLKNAASHFGVPQQEPAHHALADARTAALVACAIRRAEIAAAAEGAA